MAPKYAALIGTPYSKMNCWDVAREFYRLEMGEELKHYMVDSIEDREAIKNLIYANSGEFFKVDTPEFGDLMLIKIRGIESHIAVYLGQGRLLHSMQSAGCVVDRVDRWDKVILGYYRLGVTR